MDFSDIGVNDPTVRLTLCNAFRQRVVSCLMVGQDPEGLRVTVDVDAVPRRAVPCFWRWRGWGRFGGAGGPIAPLAMHS